MQGKLVNLRGYEKSDVDALIRWFSDEEGSEHIGGRYVDVVTMGLLRADFAASRP